MLPSIFKTCALFLDKGYYSKCIPVSINDHYSYLLYTQPNIAFLIGQ